MSMDAQGSIAGVSSLNVLADQARGSAAWSASRGRIAPERARQAAEEFVAQTLVQPILKQMRDTNRAFGPFAPGAHEKTFASMLDTEVAKSIVKSSRFPLVDAVARRLLEDQRPEPSAAGAATARADSSETKPHAGHQTQRARRDP